jgi:hypothetical protein
LINRPANRDFVDDATPAHHALYKLLRGLFQMIRRYVAVERHSVAVGIAVHKAQGSIPGAA